jgi:predicted RecB family endonuclease
MTPALLTSIRELDSRMSHGIQVRLLWSELDGRVWVAVLDTASRDSFCVEVRAGECAVNVFHHPYAYAGLRGIPTVARPTATEADQALAA